MYDSGVDPYCYPGTAILKNRLNLRDQTALDEFEALITAQRAEEPLPAGRLGYSHYRAIHKHLFQDLYTWAGKPRTIRIAKAGSRFCYPEHIDAEMHRVFGDLRTNTFLRGRSPRAFADGAALLLSELNAVHCFREGNGRTQLTFLTLLATRAGHPLILARLDPPAMLAAMIHSFHTDEQVLARLIEALVADQA